MEKLGLIIKQETGRVLKDRLEKCKSNFLLVRYSGLSASDLSELRRSLSVIGSYLMVIKNCVSKRLFKSSQDLSAQIIGPCGLIFINKDLISTTQVIYKFNKEKPGLQVKVGFLKDEIITDKQIESLSEIPSLPALQGQLAGGLKAPICGFVLALKNVLNKLVWVLDRIRVEHKGGENG
jgi:large subunit ribosomal protein L10